MATQPVVWDNYLDWARHMRGATTEVHFEPVFIQAHSRAALIVLRFLFAWRRLAIGSSEFQRLRRAIQSSTPDLQFLIYRPEAVTPADHLRYAHLYDVLDVGAPVQLT